MSAPTDESRSPAEPDVEEREYEVTLSGTTYTTVTVEAATEEDAAAAALERVKFAYYDWDDDVSFPEVESIVVAS